MFRVFRFLISFIFSFDKWGKRANFSFDVVELGTGGVSSGAANIGTWSDDGGLSIIKNGITYSRPGSESHGKKTTYVLTSVLEQVRPSKSTF